MNPKNIYIFFLHNGTVVFVYCELILNLGVFSISQTWQIRLSICILLFTISVKEWFVYLFKFSESWLFWIREITIFYTMHLQSLPSVLSDFGSLVSIILGFYGGLFSLLGSSSCTDICLIGLGNSYPLLHCTVQHSVIFIRLCQDLCKVNLKKKNL